MSNECARRLRNVATTSGVPPTSLARVPGRPQKLLVGECRGAIRSSVPPHSRGVPFGALYAATCK